METRIMFDASNPNYLLQFLVRIGSNLERICNRVLIKYNLTQQHLNVLNEVQRNKGITQQQIIDMYGYEKSNLSKIIHKLVNLRYIKLNPSETDKRVNLITISRTGTRVWEKCIEDLNIENEKIFHNIDNNDIIKYNNVTFDIFKIIMSYEK